jgi:hypothetical protein
MYSILFCSVIFFVLLRISFNFPTYMLFYYVLYLTIFHWSTYFTTYFTAYFIYFATYFILFHPVFYLILLCIIFYFASYFILFYYTFRFILLRFFIFDCILLCFLWFYLFYYYVVCSTYFILLYFNLFYCILFYLKPPWGAGPLLLRSGRGQDVWARSCGGTLPRGSLRGCAHQRHQRRGHALPVGVSGGAVGRGGGWWRPVDQPIHSREWHCVPAYRHTRIPIQHMHARRYTRTAQRTSPVHPHAQPIHWGPCTGVRMVCECRCYTGAVRVCARVMYAWCRLMYGSVCGCTGERVRGYHTGDVWVRTSSVWYPHA